tara:strand:+ start:3133 stop:3822 length:690 start_codon:yes stop_codon:yes gene_type:complete
MSDTETNIEGQGTPLDNLKAAPVAAPAASTIDAQKNAILSNLSKEDTVLLSARGVKGNKVELTFASHITNPTRTGTSNPLVAILNQSDDRFTSNKPRQGWITGMKSDILDKLGLDVNAINEGDELIINKLNPELGGIALKLQIVETTKADDYQALNIETKAKRAGKDGDYILHNGMYIFSNTYVVPCEAEPEHTWLKSDATTNTSQGIVAQPTVAVSPLAEAQPSGLAM